MQRRYASLVVLAAVFIIILMVAPDVMLIVFAGSCSTSSCMAAVIESRANPGLSHGAGVGIFPVRIATLLAGSISAFAPAMSRTVAVGDNFIHVLLRPIERRLVGACAERGGAGGTTGC